MPQIKHAKFLVAEAVAKAEDARSILDSRVFKEAFEALEARYLDNIRRSAPTDTESREHNFRLLSILDQLKADLQAVVAGGDVARFNNKQALKD